ncbi:immunoglobulin-binding protein 1b isoform X2 [Cephus cinctus]|uniref:Immunoglobulin-binding protein 1b isoform X2 n=1 Tax=Cephus cinctus TaxID=211228 RepID=A0AAJ7RAE1_CEPCN|nr:immunoglobulin-binding protein 1b isoform X2 [Cephus cinctus]
MLNHCQKYLTMLFDSSTVLTKLMRQRTVLKFRYINVMTNSDVRRAMNMFEKATRLVSMANMFSENESFDEVATENIKYFLLPALLGSLTLKICGTDDRTHIVDVAEVYFIDFLNRVKAYGLTDIQIPETKNEEHQDETAVAQTKSNSEYITEMVNSRNTKLQRYREQKELEKNLEVFRKNLDNPNIDEETKREYFVTLLKVYVNQAIDELASLAAERPLLEHMKQLGRTDSTASQHQHKTKIPSAKLKPIIITRDEVQKQVFGAGYPSLPVLTVQEFYDKRVKDGDWPDASQRNQMNGTCLQDVTNPNNVDISQEDAEAIEKENRTENDDPELLAQTRAMDDYKDTHRRGWGNRANRS